MITRLFRLVADPSQLERFASVGRHNLTMSIDTEPGTLVMCATHVPDDPSVNYVFEAYRDQAAYETHAASPQFADYAALAAEVLTDREVVQTTPELLVEKEDGLRITNPASCAPRLAKVRTFDGHDEAFRTAAFANMRASVESEEGVLAMYAVTDAANPCMWYFMEVYASDDAYAAHRETEHFADYIAATADHVVEKELIALVADTIVSHGTLR